jgi:hypothetical protein
MVLPILPKRFTTIRPLSDEELSAAARYFEGASPAEHNAIPIEDHAINDAAANDPIFRDVAYYALRGAYRDPPHPSPPPDHVAHAAEIFQRIAPNWWRSIGLGMFD